QNNTHYNFLRMLEDMYSLPYSGASSAVVPIDYCWQSALPVELSSFTAQYLGKVINLKWETKTEINLDNYTIERSSDNKNFQMAGEVKAKGNSVTPLLYTFNDTEIEPGTYYYRLKMIDMDGTYKYSNLMEVHVDVPETWSLNQNYPNPFNPSTVITYSVANESRISLNIYNALGEKVSGLNEGMKAPGYYQVNFNGAGLPSGIYFYRLNVLSPDGKEYLSSLKKMILLK
ncbi:MAG: T9SS type A sorting domain-containing protein, partial [Ignavibacteriaceae bacterium]|nr:T9SS type A sorting domain-containing protein [Ignavibacteriaceae bacterium]